MSSEGGPFFKRQRLLSLCGPRISATASASMPSPPGQLEMQAMVTPLLPPHIFINTHTPLFVAQLTLIVAALRGQGGSGSAGAMSPPGGGTAHRHSSAAPLHEGSVRGSTSGERRFSLGLRRVHVPKPTANIIMEVITRAHHVVLEAKLLPVLVGLLAAAVISTLICWRGEQCFQQNAQFIRDSFGSDTSFGGLEFLNQSKVGL